MSVDGVGCIDGALSSTIQSNGDFQVPIYEAILSRIQEAFARFSRDGSSTREALLCGHGPVVAGASVGPQPSSLDMVA
jgi:hypothetical protein